MNKIEIHWEITNACNLKCKHCIIDAGQSLKDEMTTEECFDALEKMKQAGVEVICYTGGEPFCKKDFREILEKTISLKIQPQIITNGTLLNDDWIDFLYINNIPIGVSLDGYNEKTNDYIRGEGTYKKIVAFLQKANQKEMSISLYVTATKDNTAHLHEIFELAKKYNCNNVHINDLSVGGRHNNNADYALNKEHGVLIKKINKASVEVFEEELMGPDYSCWVNGRSILLTSNGNLYNCTEIKKVNPNNYFGNIKTFPLKKWIEDNNFLDYLNCDCCYHVYYNTRISVTKNEDIPCALVEHKKEITTLKELYEAFDRLNAECNIICGNCEYPDCKGYIWLMNEEVEKLYDCGIELIELNNNIHMLYSFKNERGETDLTIKQPQCVHRCDNGNCNIHDIRPLVCHMYPVGPETVDGAKVWVLHNSCQFTENMKNENKLSEYIYQVKKIIDSISKELYEEILKNYEIMDYLSTFPDGENSCIIISEMKI